MSITTPERLHDPEPQDNDWVTNARPAVDDTVAVTCGSCNSTQHASGRARGYVCETCGTDWEVMRCRECREVSIVHAGTTECPRCSYEHQRPQVEASPRVPTWLIEPDPLSVWIGGVKYLGGHAERNEPITVAGLLLDRRGIHLRAFSELFTISWDTILGISIEGPHEISERMTTSRLLALGATTWELSVAYVTVRTNNGDAIFEVVGLGPPQVHARLSRVLQGLQRTESPPAPVVVDRGESIAPEPSRNVVPPVAAPVTAPVEPSAETHIDLPAAEDSQKALDIDALHSEAPLEVLVIDALWKLARLREQGMLDDSEVAQLRTRLLARVTADAPAPSGNAGPLLHV